MASNSTVRERAVKSDRGWAEQLTICTVITQNHVRMLSLNLQMVRALNEGLQPLWVVVDNSPERSRDLVQQPEGVVVTWVDGIAQDKKYPILTAGSYQHGAALNKAIKRVSTRFLLVLDPDFFIVSSGWIADVLAEMSTHGIAIAGVPWHPKWFTKYRRFPCVHCMFIDLKLIPASELDFIPSLEPALFDQIVKKYNRISSSLKSKSAAHRRVEQTHNAIDGSVREGTRLSTLFVWIRSLYHFTINRAVVGSSKDTGYKIFEKYIRHADIKVLSFTPVVDEAIDFVSLPHLRSVWGRRIERLVPRSLRYLPCTGSDFVPHGFREWGFQDMRSKGWEEFHWKGRPFGFHVRMSRQVFKSTHEEPFVAIDDVQAGLDRIVAALGKPGLV